MLNYLWCSFYRAFLGCVYHAAAPSVEIALGLRRVAIHFLETKLRMKTPHLVDFLKTKIKVNLCGLMRV